MARFSTCSKNAHNICWITEISPSHTSIFKFLCCEFKLLTVYSKHFHDFILHINVNRLTLLVSLDRTVNALINNVLPSTTPELKANFPNNGLSKLRTFVNILLLLYTNESLVKIGEATYSVDRTDTDANCSIPIVQNLNNRTSDDFMEAFSAIFYARYIVVFIANVWINIAFCNETTRFAYKCKSAYKHIEWRFCNKTHYSLEIKAVIWFFSLFKIKIILYH